MILTHARNLTADVERLPEGDDFFFVDRCLSVAERARALGAHSVARAVEWMAGRGSMQHGYERTFWATLRAAERWLHREEVRALRVWGQR